MIYQYWFTPPTSATFCFLINCIQMGNMDSNEESKRANLYKRRLWQINKRNQLDVTLIYQITGHSRVMTSCVKL